MKTKLITQIPKIRKKERNEGRKSTQGRKRKAKKPCDDNKKLKDKTVHPWFSSSTGPTTEANMSFVLVKEMAVKEAIASQLSGAAQQLRSCAVLNESSIFWYFFFLV